MGGDNSGRCCYNADSVFFLLLKLAEFLFLLTSSKSSSSPFFIKIVCYALFVLARLQQVVLLLLDPPVLLVIGTHQYSFVSWTLQCSPVPFVNHGIFCYLCISALVSVSCAFSLSGCSRGPQPSQSCHSASPPPGALLKKGGNLSFCAYALLRALALSK